MTGRIWVPPGCCQSRRRPREVPFLAARCVEFWDDGHLHIVNEGHGAGGAL